MAYFRMPGAVPKKYVAAIVKKTEEGQAYSTLQALGAGPVPEGEFEVALGIAKGDALAREWEVPFYVRVHDDDWDAAAWGELKDDFVAR